MISGPPQKRCRHLRQITDKELRRIDERKYSGLPVSPSGRELIMRARQSRRRRRRRGGGEDGRFPAAGSRLRLSSFPFSLLPFFLLLLLLLLPCAARSGSAALSLSPAASHQLQPCSTPSPQIGYMKATNLMSDSGAALINITSTRRGCVTRRRQELLPGPPPALGSYTRQGGGGPGLSDLFFFFLKAK